MKFKYHGDAEEIEIPALRLIVKKGDTFEAVGDDAKGLKGQDALYEHIVEKSTSKSTADEGQKE